MDPGIICFEHCKSKFFCFNLPETCPECKVKLCESSDTSLPFRVPSPFIQAPQQPCSVIMKPTNGDFLNDYFNSMDLHIGVTTSQGFIVEFDQNGLRNHKSDQWNQALLLEQIDEPWFDHWDQTLRKVCEETGWSKKDYHEDGHNCYSFVLKFLKSLKCGSLSSFAESKTLFCEKLIVPRTSNAAKYISMYRKLRQDDGGCCKIE